jgi:Fur family ferric uptake transcriptional regulator
MTRLIEVRAPCCECCRRRTEKHVSTTFKLMSSVKQSPTAQERIAQFRSTPGPSSRKWSVPRERILNAFLSQSHITVHELYGLLNINGQRVSLSTIYRTMGMLCKMGIARLRHFGEKAQYDNVSSKGDHDHLICTDCGQIIEFKDSAIEKLRQQIAAVHGFCLTGQNLEVYGLCSRCRPGVEVVPSRNPLALRSTHCSWPLPVPPSTKRFSWRNPRTGKLDPL